MNREQLRERNKKLKQIIKPDKRLLERCEVLRYAVEHPNERSDIIMEQGIYKHKDPEAIMIVTVDGVVVGYKVKPCSDLEINPYFDRYVYIKVPGYRFTDLSALEMSAIKTAVFEAFFEPQQGEVHVEVIGFDAILMWQRFMVVFPVRTQQSTMFVPGSFNA